MSALIGRERELHRLQAGVSRALAGAGSLALISGEPGIGKTRLADEVAAFAADRGALVSWGRCWESGGAPTFWPWTQIFEALVRSERLARDAEEDRLGALFGAVSQSPGDDAAAAPDPSRGRFELHRAAFEALRAAGARGPLMLVIDDLHAADLSSLQLLSFVCRSLREVPIALFCTYRSVGVRLPQESQELIGRIGREGTTVRLGPLAREEVGKLLQERGLPDVEQVAERVHVRTEGNPLFVHELAELLLAHGPGDDTGELAVPLSVRETVRQRVEALEPAHRRLLSVAAVFGNQLEVEALARALDGEVEHVRDGVRRLQEAGLLAGHSDGGPAFAHGLLREVVYADLSAEERAELHLRVAEAIAANGAGGPRARSSELAHHYLLAGPAGYERAVVHAVAAARAAAHGHAHEDAAALLERAIGTIRTAGASAAHLLCDLQLALGTTCMRAGAVERGEQACFEAVELARQVGDPERLARSALALGAEFSPARTDPRLLGLLEEARAGLSGDHFALQSRLLARLAAALQPHRDARVPVAMALEAIALARRAGDRSVMLEVLYSASAALIEFCDSGRLLPLMRELVQLCLDAGDRPRLLRAYLLTAYVELEDGRRAAAEARLADYKRLARELSLLPHSWTLPMADATLAYLDGRCDDALRLADEAHAMARAAGLHVDTRVNSFRFVLLWEREADPDQLAVIGGQILASLTGTPGATPLGEAFTGAADVRAGRLERARAIMAALPDDVPNAVEAHLMTEVVLETCHAVGVAGPMIEVIYERLLNTGSAFFTLGVYAFAIGGPVARGRALAADLLGRHDEVEAHFERALHDCEALGAELFLARTRADYGAFLARAGRPDRAEPLLRAALEAGQRLGMTGLASRVRAVLGGAPPVESATDQASRAARHALAELAAGIAHEINSPLGALRSNADLAKRALDVIREAMTDPELSQVMGKHAKVSRALEALGSLHSVTPEATERIHSVVSELRSFARLDRAEIDDVDLRVSLDEALRLIAHRTDGRIEVRRNYAALPRLRCHPEQLNEALLTVLSTAIERIEGPGTLDVAVGHDDGWISLEVVHSGRAFAPDEVERLFSPNLQRGGGAVGLRLRMPIAKQAVEDHGGTLEVDPQPGPGSCIRLRLPLSGAPS